MKLLIPILFSVTLLSCTTKKEIQALNGEEIVLAKSTEETILVNYKLVDCQGVGEMKCMEIKNADNTNSLEGWTLFYSSIKGFTYEPGYLYTLKIKKTELDPKMVPADGSTLEYSLIEMIDKTEILASAIEGEWKVSSITGVEQKLVAKAAATLLLTDGRMGGNDGCNFLTSSYKEKGQSIRFTTIGQTKRACMDRDLSLVANAYTKNLSETSSYKLEDNVLTFYKGKGEILITFSRK